MIRILTAAIVLLLLHSHALAEQKFTWTGSVNNAWTNMSNWDPMGVPGVSSTGPDVIAVIPAGMGQPNLTGVVDIGVIQAMGSIRVAGNPTIHTSALLTDVVFFGANFTNIITAHGGVQIKGFSIWQTGQFTGSGIYSVAGATDSLLITTSPHSRQLNAAIFENHGLVTQASLVDLLNGSTVLNSDAWVLNSQMGGTLPASQNGVFINTGTLSHDSTTIGTMSVPLNNNGGTIVNSVGTMRISKGGQHSGGIYSLQDGATIELRGFVNDQGQQDGVHISSMNASGSGNLRFTNGMTFIDGNLSLNVDDGGDPLVHGAWLSQAGIVQCNGTMSNQSKMTWSAATLAGAGEVTNAQGGVMTIQTVAGDSSAPILSTTLRNLGTAVQTADLRLNAGKVVVGANGFWRLLGGSFLNTGGTADNEVRIEGGELQKPSNATGNTAFNVPLRLSEAGTLRVNSHDVSLNVGGGVTGSGNVIEAGPAGTVSMPSGIFDVTGSLLFQGSGFILLSGGQLGISNGSVVCELGQEGTGAFMFTSGSISGTGSGSTSFTNQGAMHWSGGTITPGTMFENQANSSQPALLQFTGAGQKLLRGTLTNRAGARIVHAAGMLLAEGTLKDGGDIHNRGTYEIMGGANVVMTQPGFLANEADGLLLKTRGGTAAITGPFSNGTEAGGAAEVRVDSGALDINGPLAQLIRGTLSHGTWRAQSGAVLRFPESVTCLNGAELIAASNACVPDVHLQCNGGTLETTGDFDVDDGYECAGTTRVREGTLHCDGDYTNGGETVVEEGGTVTCDDEYDNFLQSDIDDDCVTSLEGGDMVVNGPCNNGGELLVDEDSSLSCDELNNDLDTDGDGGRIVSEGGDIVVDGPINNGDPDQPGTSLLFDMEKTLTIAVAGGPGGGGGQGANPGRFFCTVLNNAGQVTPGGHNLPGSFDVTGDFFQFPSGILNIELGGLTPIALHDQLIVDGDITLDGTLRVALLGDYEPRPGDQFQIISVERGHDITGQFDSIDTTDGQFALTYESDQVILTFIAPAILGDLNNDGLVNGIDLGILLSQWFTPGGGSADLNDDSQVNGIDLGILLNNWTF